MSASSVPWLLVTGDFVKTGGMDVANYALASYLAREGAEVHLVAHRVDSSLPANVRFHEAAKPLNSYYLGRKRLDRLGRTWAERIASRGGRVLVNGGNCQWGDVNWVHYVHAAYRPQVSGGWVRRAVHAWKRRAFLEEERRAVGEARVVIANSQRTRRTLIEKLGVHPHRVKVAYYGCDPGVLMPATAEGRAAIRCDAGWPGDGTVALFVGALGDRRKGFDVVFEAWRLLKERHGWETELAVVGRGAEAAAWERRARSVGLDGLIRFMGFREDVPRLVRAADVLVAPARYEAYGLGVHEALCSGVPAIVSACSGVAERLTPELSELLVRDPDDPHEMVLWLLQWRAQRDRYHALAVDLSRRLRQWTWDDMARRITGIACDADQADDAGGEVALPFAASGAELSGDVPEMSATVARGIEPRRVPE